ncbi:hypothetical protein [Muribaculum intestinale]|uniref:Uncharacterized protein n=1 Tax=Muribaculum intestinale TaxID=1796646 RepID=A0A4S2FXJ0_9BACT|nr:hypothetical protein [Muribaculum intestinale]MYM12894.1 hypothetical protein [Muribaculum intestinale]TGY74106.1 hypothetical protein E5333_07470 [Muribaculum intestinale]
MKKKYRRAVYFTLISVICLIFSPILLMGAMGVIAGWVCEKWLTPIVEWLKTKLIVYDYDPD